MDPKTLNVVSAALGIIAPVLLAKGQSMTGEAVDASLELAESGVVSASERRGPVFLNVDKLRSRAKKGRRWFSGPGWVSLFLSFAFRLAALLSG